MATKDKFEKTWYGKAIRLMEGGIEEVDGHYIRMVRFNLDIHPCDVCEMDCICTTKPWGVQDMCCFIESLTNRRFYLELTEKRNGARGTR